MFGLRFEMHVGLGGRETDRSYISSRLLGVRNARVRLQELPMAERRATYQQVETSKRDPSEIGLPLSIQVYLDLARISVNKDLRNSLDECMIPRDVDGGG